MPYFITDSSPDCSGWATVKDDGEVIGCHTTKQEAIDQMVAVSIAEEIEPGGERLKKKNKMKKTDYRVLPDNYRPSLSEDVPEGRACGNCVFYIESDVKEFAGGELRAWCEKWDDYVNGAYYCNAWQPALEDRAEPNSLNVNDFVSWNSSGGRARGRIERIVNDGTINVPDSSFSITGTPDDPAALIRIYRPDGNGWDETDTLVGHKFSTLTKIDDLPENTLDEDDDEERQVNLTPPAYMRAAARRGLELNRQGFGGDGLTDKTKQEARDMAAGRVSEDKWRRIAPWIARHLVDLDAPQNSKPDDAGYPGAGLVAHFLWGSGPSKRAAQRTQSYAENIVNRLNQEKRHGTHDQSSHGSWAGGARQGKNLLDDGTLVKGNALDQSLSEKTSKFVPGDFADGKTSEDLALKEIADRQGFSGQAQRATSQTEYDAIKSPKIESGPLKGQDVISQKELHRGFRDSGDKKVKAEKAKNEFESGKYYAGKGIIGNGTYVATNLDKAKKYSEGQSLDNISSFKLSPEAKIGSFNELHIDLLTNKAGSRTLPESVEFDVGRYAASLGFDGYVMDTSIGGGVYTSITSVEQLVILNRTAIILPPKG